MVYYLRKKLIDILVKAFLQDLKDFPAGTLTKEQEDGMLSQMWESAAFRKRLANRDAKILFTMAGGEGMMSEPRDAYVLHMGQRTENLLLGRDAKAAYERVTGLKTGGLKEVVG